VVPVANNFKIDTTATFEAVAFLGCVPKVGFGSKTQEMTKDGMPKWVVEVVAGFRGQFGTSSEVLKVGVAAPRNPCDGMSMYTPLQLINFEVGVMEKTKKNPQTGEERVIGVTVWYRAEGVRALAVGKAA
jgi:hypothetical protein